MTSRRYAHTLPTQTLTGGDERPAGNCHGLAARMAPFPTPFDVLTEGSQGGETRKLAAAKAEALNLCVSCVLRPTCWAENRNEPWMLTLRGKPVPRHPKRGAA